MGALGPPVPVELIRRELPAPLYIDARALSANTEEAHTKPAGAVWLWIINTDGTNAVWCRFDGSAAAIPAADIVDGSGSLPVLSGNGLLLNMKSSSQVSLISAGASVVALAWYPERGA